MSQIDNALIDIFKYSTEDRQKGFETLLTLDAQDKFDAFARIIDVLNVYSCDMSANYLKVLYDVLIRNQNNNRYCKLSKDMADFLASYFPDLPENLSLYDFEQYYDLLQIGQFEDIVYLNLFFNDIEYLDLNEFSVMFPNVEYLVIELGEYVDNSKIKSIVGLDSMVNLKEIEINGGDNLESIEDFVNLTGLVSLKIDSPNLLRIPKIPQCTKIVVIDAIDSRVIDKETIDNLYVGELAQFEFNNSNIDNLPLGISKCEKLEKLTFFNCRNLEEIPQDFVKCENIKSINVSYSPNIILNKDFNYNNIKYYNY